MLKHVQDGKEARELMLHLLPVAASLAGLAIASLGLLRFSGVSPGLTVGDDLLAFSALAFLVSCYLIFWALRARDPQRALKLGRIVDTVFLGAMTCIVCAGFVMVYAVV
jgi:hypothetical protein